MVFLPYLAGVAPAPTSRGSSTIFRPSPRPWGRLPPSSIPLTAGPQSGEDPDAWPGKTPTLSLRDSEPRRGLMPSGGLCNWGHEFPSSTNAALCSAVSRGSPAGEGREGGAAARPNGRDWDPAPPEPGDAGGEAHWSSPPASPRPRSPSPLPSPSPGSRAGNLAPKF